MPQPLSSVDSNATVSLGNSNDAPSNHRPMLALLAMRVIAEWSILESFLTGLFIQMLGSDPKPGVAMYSALTGSTAQNAAFLALAEVRLSEEEKDVFDAILSLYKTAAKERNKYAHWVWGHSPQIKDGVLLADPEVMIEIRLMVHDLEEALKRGKHGPHPDIPKDRIYVFYEKDFLGTSEKIQKLIGMVIDLQFVLRRDHPANRDGRLLRRLLDAPEIAEFLSRLYARRKTAQEAQKQSPQQARPE